MPENPPRLISASCVIPAWNASNTIARALNSVLATAGIGEVILVDDGSTDDTAAKVKQISAKAQIPVRLIQQENAGAAAARNTGMRAANLDWITFLDADDEMLPQAIIGKQSYLETCPDPERVSAIHGSFLKGDNGDIGQFSESKICVKPDGIGRLGHFPGGVVSYVFRRASLLATGGFRAEFPLYEDFEFILRYIAQGNRVVGCNIPGFRRHYTAGSLSRGTKVAKRLRVERQFLSIARRDSLMSRAEIFRRLMRNRVRQLFHILTGR